MAYRCLRIDSYPTCTRASTATSSGTNTIGKNNLDGVTLDSPASPEDLKTTGVLVFSGGTRVTVTISRNVIFDNSIGIRLSKPVKAFGLGTNTFFNVTTSASANH